MLSPTAVNVTWYPPVVSDWNGLITEYNISYESLDSIANGLSGSYILQNFVNGDNPNQAPGNENAHNQVYSVTTFFFNSLLLFDRTFGTRIHSN